VAVAVLVASAAFGAEAGVMLGSATYYGGTGAEYAFGATAANGGLYVAGAAPVGPGGAYQGLGLFYSPASAASPTWSLTWPDTSTSGRRGDYFYGVSATSTGAYFAGNGASLASDGVGDFEGKSLLASFPLSGATGSGLDGANWYRSPNVFPYTGGETFFAGLADESLNAVFAVGGGETFGFGRQAAFAFRYDSSGTEVWRKTIGTTGGTDFSRAEGVALMGGELYVAGVTQYPYNSPAAENATLWSLDPATGAINWQKTTPGYLTEIVDDGTSLFAVGRSGTDALIVAYDDDGNVLWRTDWGGAGTEYAHSLVIDGDVIYVAGETNSFGSGGVDAFLLEVSALTGDVLASTYWGGTGDDRAWDVERIGNALYLVGYTDSHGAGSMDVFVLSATITGVPEPGSLGLLAVGLGGVAFARGRKPGRKSR
jgi:hypothetical protein